MKKIFFVLFIPLLMVLFSCSAKIDGTVREGGAANIVFETSLGPGTTGFLRSLSPFMGNASNAPVLDGPAMARSMASAPGISSVSISNTSPSSLEGNISISNVGDFLSSPAVSGASRGYFITYTEGRTTGTSSLVIILDRNSTPGILFRLSPEIGEYLEALLAPAATGTVMTRQEYLGMITAFYGRTLAAEITAAHIHASVEFPRPLTSVLGGSADGNRANFDIPLVDLLVLETPLRYEAYW